MDRGNNEPRFVAFDDALAIVQHLLWMTNGHRARMEIHRMVVVKLVRSGLGLHTLFERATPPGVPAFLVLLLLKFSPPGYPVAIPNSSHRSSFPLCSLWFLQRVCHLRSFALPYPWLLFFLLALFLSLGFGINDKL